MKAKSPKSIKQKRARFNQRTDRLISGYNRNSLLPDINDRNSNYNQNMNDTLRSSLDLTASFNNNNNKRNMMKNNNMKYQRNFVVKSPKSKIEKSKLGKAIFGDK